MGASKYAEASENFMVKASEDEKNASWCIFKLQVV